MTVLRCGHAHVVCFRDLSGRDLVVDEVARTTVTKWQGDGAMARTVRQVGDVLRQ